MLQLVDERVCVLNPPKDNLICDRAKVEEILGVPPERVIDVMALRGDSIDNMPGAPGIGDKGSVELIQRFGSLDNLLEHVGEVERKTYRESLLHNRDAVLLSRELVTIDRNVAVEFNPESMKAQPPDVPAARQLFTELEFTSLVKEFLEEGTEIGETDYHNAGSGGGDLAVAGGAGPRRDIGGCARRRNRLNGGSRRRFGSRSCRCGGDARTGAAFTDCSAAGWPSEAPRALGEARFGTARGVLRARPTGGIAPGVRGCRSGQGRTRFEGVAALACNARTGTGRRAA